VRPKHSAVFICFPRTQRAIGQLVTLTLSEPCGNLYFVMRAKMHPPLFYLRRASQFFFILLSFIPLTPSLSSSRVCLLHPAGTRATGCRPHFISDFTGHFISAEANLLKCGADPAGGDRVYCRADVAYCGMIVKRIQIFTVSLLKPS